MLKNIFLFLILLLSSFYSLAKEHLEQSYEEKIQQILEELQKDYSITFLYQEVPTSSWYEDVTANIAEEKDFEDLLKYLRLFEKEWRKYSKNYVLKTNVKQVAFVKNLAYAGQSRAALPDAYKEILYYDFLVGNYDSTYQKHVVHHEYYHMIEEQFNGSQYYKDPIWNSFNEKDFVYGKGGAYARGGDQYPLTHPLEGFMNLYSTSGLEEDKAEVYAYIFVEEEFEIVKDYLSNDAILRKKVKYMKKFIEKLNEKDDDSRKRTKNSR
jgi:hypothetical protein